MSHTVPVRRSSEDTVRHRQPQDAAPPVIATVRAVLALGWAAALVLAVGNDIPRTDSDVPVAAAALLASYPVIDVVASLVGAAAAGSAGRALRINAAISAVASVAIAATAFGSDVGATLVAFGSWAAVSGAIQLAIAVHRRGQGGQLSMIVSGGLSTIAGLSFLLAAGEEDVHLVNVAGYMALGALLFLVFAFQTRTTPASRR